MKAALAIGAGLTATLIGTALISFVWTPWPTDTLDIAQRLAPPGAAHWLGTDALGRDQFSLLMAGARASLAVALVAVGLGAAVGIPAGLYAAERGGWPGEIVARAGDLVFAFPALLIAVLLAALAGPGLLNAIVAIAIFTAPVFARVARAGALQLWPRDFVAAARASGKSRGRISLEHILPNLSGPLIVQATIQAALAIVAEAGLAYVGLGARPPQPSWGRMLAEAQTLAAAAPWLAIWPGVAIATAVLGLNLLGDGLSGRLSRR